MATGSAQRPPVTVRAHTSALATAQSARLRRDGGAPTYAASKPRSGQAHGAVASAATFPERASKDFAVPEAPGLRRGLLLKFLGIPHIFASVAAPSPVPAKT